MSFVFPKHLIAFGLCLFTLFSGFAAAQTAPNKPGISFYVFAGYLSRNREERRQPDGL